MRTPAKDKQEAHPGQVGSEVVNHRLGTAAHWSERGSSRVVQPTDEAGNSQCRIQMVPFTDNACHRRGKGASLGGPGRLRINTLIFFQWK